MASKNRPVYDLRGHCEIQGDPYELLIYRVDNEFYAFWSCEVCAAQGETDLVPDRDAAKEKGVAAFEMHQTKCRRNDAR
jgi:hypothetical protein